MTDITKRATFYPAKRRAPKLFHIEVEGATVNITVGLTDRFGRHVTTVEIIPDDGRRGGDGQGRAWTLADDGRLVRQFRDCRCHTRDTDGTGAGGAAVDPIPVTCGSCGQTWCDRCTPTPAARCPYEYDHPNQ